VLAVLKVVMNTAMALACLIGPGMLLYGLRQRARARASEAWPHVMGKIASSDIITNEDGSRVVVEYDYAVEGVAYRGKRLRFVDWTDPRN
jgi:hypothetical protein